MPVHRSAFTPPPKVMSAVVHIVPARGARRGRGRAMLERLTAAAFGQRRKMLRQSLKGVPGALDGAGGAGHRPDAAGGDGRRVAELVALARAIDSASGV